MHLVVDGRGLPLVFHLTAGNVNDSTVFEQVIEQIRITRPDGGRPRTQPGCVLGDKATQPNGSATTCAAAASVV